MSGSGGFGLAPAIRPWAGACLLAGALFLGVPAASEQGREDVGRTLNDLFIAIYRNSGVMNGIFENCAGARGAAGEFFDAVHGRYVRNDSVIAGMIVAVHRKVMERQTATGAVRPVEQLSRETRDLAYSEIRRKFIVANGRPELERRLCDDLMEEFRTGRWDNPRYVEEYFRLLERFDPRVYAEFRDMKDVLDDRRAGRLGSGPGPK